MSESFRSYARADRLPSVVFETGVVGERRVSRCRQRFRASIVAGRSRACPTAPFDVTVASNPFGLAFGQDGKLLGQER